MKVKGTQGKAQLVFEIETAILQITPPYTSQIKNTRTTTLMHLTAHEQPMRRAIASLPFK